VHTEITDTIAKNNPCVYYDAECRFCCESVCRLAPILIRRGFAFRPLQSPEARQQFGSSDHALLREMRLSLADGRILGGADAVVEIARHVWWAWPLWLFSRLPGARRFLHALYQVIAANRHCLGGACRMPDPRCRRHRAHVRHRAFFKLP
jgi:predicted DCC family thiol-disulfide oxidoreductase YuxK